MGPSTWEPEPWDQAPSPATHHVYVLNGGELTVWRIAPDRFIHHATGALRISETTWGKDVMARSAFSARSYFLTCRILRC